jgi:hypothetical protein
VLNGNLTACWYLSALRSVEQYYRTIGKFHSLSYRGRWSLGQRSGKENLFWDVQIDFVVHEILLAMKNNLHSCKLLQVSVLISVCSGPSIELTCKQLGFVLD